MPVNANALQSLTRAARERNALEARREKEAKRAQKIAQGKAARQRAFVKAIEEDILHAAWHGQESAWRDTLTELQLEAVMTAQIAVECDVGSATIVNRALDTVIPRLLAKLSDAIIAKGLLEDLEVVQRLSGLTEIEDFLLSLRQLQYTSEARIPPCPPIFLDPLIFLRSKVEKIDELYAVRMMERGFHNPSRAPAELRTSIMKNVLNGLGLAEHLVDLERSELTILLIAARKNLSFEEVVLMSAISDLVTESRSDAVRDLKKRAIALAKLESCKQKASVIVGLNPSISTLLQTIADTRERAARLNYDPESLALGYSISASYELKPVDGSTLWKQTSLLLSGKAKKAIRSFARTLEGAATEGLGELILEVEDKGDKTWIRPMGSPRSSTLPTSLGHLISILSRDGIRSQLSSSRKQPAQLTLSWFQ